MTTGGLTSSATRGSLEATEETNPARSHELYGPKSTETHEQPNVFVRAVRALFGYRKTSLTFLVFVSIIATALLSCYDRSLDYTVSFPTEKLEAKVLDTLWSALQEIARNEHTYASEDNDRVHDYLEEVIGYLVDKKPYMEYDNDLDNTHSFLRQTSPAGVTYYESNNLVVRINGSNPDLPALLLSAHYDSVPTSFGVTDDGMGIASLVGVLDYFAAKLTKRPERTIIINLNNNEEFGLYGALAFLSHPWFKQIGYFLNLEGTGAGGKAILFRGTDYGIIKFFKNVRFPYANSLFQQGFSGRLVHSETDYKYYAELGHLRGLDLAFFRPRDFYHTAKDNIANVDKKSLWHMLSSTIDFTNGFVSGAVDLDDSKEQRQAAAFTSLFNFFFAVPVTVVFGVNVFLMVVVPILTLVLLFLIVAHRKWSVSMVTFLKFPISFVFSVLLLDNFSTWFVVPANSLLPNSSAGIIALTYFTFFVLLNYLLLNGINWLFGRFKGVNHDEKLVVILQVSFMFWVSLVWSTAKLAQLQFNGEHSGEFLLTVLYILQAVGGLFGLLCWLFKAPKSRTPQNQELEPLLDQTHENGYGALEQGPLLTSSSSVLLVKLPEPPVAKNYSYDWSIQFLAIVPFSSFLLYNYGWLILEGLKKTVQESATSQKLVFKTIKSLAIVGSLPFLPFIFKVNRIVILVTVFCFVYGLSSVLISEPFDAANPLKLRFLQTIDLDKAPKSSVVSVFGRDESPIAQILADMPSVKQGETKVTCDVKKDGLKYCTYEGMAPHLVPGVHKAKELMLVKVLTNSSKSTNYPFGMLDGKFEIRAKKNRECRLLFHEATGSKRLDLVVKTVVVYRGDTNSTEFLAAKIPDGFSTDSDGNFVYKNMTGISELSLNKLDWDRPYTIAVQWVANLDDADTEPALNVSVSCYWAELSPLAEKGKLVERIPAYNELLQYSPNYVSWANQEQGLVRVVSSTRI